VYSIGSGDDDNDFAIAQNGTIYTTRLLDRETKSLYNLVVMATDQAKDPQHRLSSTVQVGTTVLHNICNEQKVLFVAMSCLCFKNHPVCSGRGY
jgi:protocadherin Fat 4